MRFPIAWANTVAQNISLKVAVIALVFVATTLAITTAQLAFRKPLIIERACYDQALEFSSSAHTHEEIETFVREVIRQRFNSDATPIPDYLGIEEESARTQEQKELGSRNMTQTIIVRSMKIIGNSITIDTDRLISVEQIRSAFPFQLMATLATTTRTAANPYGLQIVKIVTPATDTSRPETPSTREKNREGK